jgi:PAS domain S-box-containing protein
LIASFLRQRRDELIRQWEERVCAGPCEVKLAGAALRDHLPAFIDELAGWIERAEGLDAPAPCPSAASHAVQRLDQAVQLAQFLREYRLLREVVLGALLGEEARLHGEGTGCRGDRLLALARLDAGLERAVCGAVERFIAERDLRSARLAAAEQARRTAEQRYENLIQLSPDAVVVYRDDRITFANAAALALVGAASLDDLAGRSPFELVHPADRAGLRERARGLLAGERGVSPRMEVRTVGLHGEERTVEVNAAAFDDASGRAIEAVLRDVTEDKQAGEALRASEERLRAHIDNSPLAVIEFDPHFGITRWSQEAERLFGWTAEEVIGRKIQELRWIHEEDVECVRQESLRLLSGERTRTLNVNRNYRKDGSVVHCQWYNSALHDADGRLISILSQVLDVTERERAQEELRAANRRKTEFLAILSHELRNYLAPLSNGLRLLGLTVPGGPQFERSREIVRRQVDHLTSLVDDLLDISRVDTGKIRLERTRFDARDTIQRGCEDVRAAFDARGVRLRVELATAPLWVDADRDRLTQILANLLSNALKFTSPPGSVYVTAARAGGAVELRVRDEGIGIAPDFLPMVFDEFAQADAHGTVRSGMGIGLALVKNLVALHGGAVRAHSAGVGRGAEFVVSLPLAAPPRERAPERPRAASPRSLDVLIVDDDRDTAETLAEILRLAGHRTRVALDGRSAADAVRSRAPDVIISDVGLPDLSGYDLIRMIRRLERGAHRIFAIAVTGYAQEDDVEQARRAGFDAHLAKPASLERLEEFLAVPP